ncbi:MAG: caspase family protein [Firmicutes bacterium]|nr:caspase family protein [Bacillota bacterium]
MRRALVIGLQKYSNSPLKGCINDAKKIAQLLKYNEDNSPNFGCKLLTDENETVNWQKLKTAIMDLFVADGFEAVLLYFSGHGDIDITGGGSIIASDPREGNIGVSMDDILLWANLSNALNKIIILDCCYSGAFGNPSLNNGHLTHIGNGVTIITSSMKNQTSLQEGSQGVFTGLLIEALEGGAADLFGNITSGNIYGFIDKALGPWGQRPVFKTNINFSMPIRKVQPPISLEILKKIPIYFKTIDQYYSLDPSYEDNLPETDPEHVKILRDLQKMVSVGLVKPVGEEHMYYAVKNSKSCKLTSLGQCYWRFINEGQF